MPVVTDESTPLDVAAFAALSLGLVFVGTCHEECVQAIVQAGTSDPITSVTFIIGLEICSSNNPNPVHSFSH